MSRAKLVHRAQLRKISFNLHRFPKRSSSRWFELHFQFGCHMSKIILHLLFQSILTLGNNNKNYMTLAIPVKIKHEGII